MKLDKLMSIRDYYELVSEEKESAEVKEAFCEKIDNLTGYSKACGCQVLVIGSTNTKDKDGICVIDFNGDVAELSELIATAMNNPQIKESIKKAIEKNEKV